jgi:prepilin signal peptidase PulO-like enzyme (type II secretory pathway)
VYLALFVLIAVIDIEHRLVLNVVMIPAFALTFIEMIVTGRISLNDALVGYAVAQIVVMAFYLLGGVYLWIVSTRQGKPLGEVPFGFGDVTLATFCGMVLGFPTVLPMLMLMVLLGAAIAILYLVVRALTVRRVEAHMVIPYGPAIVLAAAILLLWQNEVAGMMLGGR